MCMMRTDIGCSDSKLHDIDNKWDPNKKTFFLNEIEPTSTTYFVRHLKFNCIPMYANLFAEKAREVYKEIQKGPVKKTVMKKAVAKKVARVSTAGKKNPAATKKKTIKATLKRPAGR